MKPSDKTEVDVTCIYCPETDACYYLRPQDHGQSVTLRVAASKNGQERGVLLASAFRDFPELASSQSTGRRHAVPPPGPGGGATSG
jgi:hypothetical protein